MFNFEVIQNANPVMKWSYNPHAKKQIMKSMIEE